MGGLFDKTQDSFRGTRNESKVIKDIYSMFVQSNKIILQSLRGKRSGLPTTKIQNIQSVIKALFDPFIRVERYSWSKQIITNFQRDFSKQFELIWYANRQQFYQFLLLNCGVKLKDVCTKQFQKYFYNKAIDTIEQYIPDAFLDNMINLKVDFNIPQGLIRVYSYDKIDEREEQAFKIKNIVHRSVNEAIQRSKSFRQNLPPISTSEQDSYNTAVRMLGSSLLLPETIFIERLSMDSRLQIVDLLKFYQQLSNTLKQVFFSNNLISCPLKHFIFKFQAQLLRKGIKTSKSSQDEQLSTTSEESRRIFKTRQTNNNLLLEQVHSFLEAYTEFVWNYFQLDQLGQSRFGKIVNFDTLYGIIFKSVWGYIDWILDRGFQFEEAKLIQYYYLEDVKNEAKISQQLSDYLLLMIEQLRNQKHPQQYIKKVALFYRQVNKHCRNADQLLLIYEQIIGKAIKGKGSKRLHLFRMKHVIQKLLKIDQSSINGGQICYAWANWSIAIELLRYKIYNKFGKQIQYQNSQLIEKKNQNSLLAEPILSVRQ